MDSEMQSNSAWTEEDSQQFVDLGAAFVPERDLQIHTLCELLPFSDKPAVVVELCCGEGLLAEAILKRYPTAIVHGLDGSEEMLSHTRSRLKCFGSRFQARLFDLRSEGWRREHCPADAIVSSLAIHHLEGSEKAELFRAMYNLLVSGGVFLVADIVQPTTKDGITYAAHQWDKVVQEQSGKVDGSQGAYEHFTVHRWNYFRHPDPGDKPSPLLDQLLWLREAGFVDVDVYWMKAGHALFGARKLV